MLKKRLLAALSLSSIVMSGLAITPIAAQASVDPGCLTTVTKGGAPANASEVEITATGIYCVAKFRTASNDYLLTVPSGITSVDYLVVAGGGGGGSGGGGGGGVIKQDGYQVTPDSTIAISVGQGGTGGAGGRSVQTAGTVGGDSKFGATTAKGGGAGGTEGVNGNVDGGSGGGSRFDCTVRTCGSGPAGSGVSPHGNNGGYSTYNSYGAGGGGGGAGGAGFNTTRTYIGGNGGVGVSSDITGSSTFYGGGGGGGINNNHNQYVGLDSNGNLVFSATAQTNGGGQGGLGGGGTGSSYGFSGGTRGQFANATSGAPNTGGGGGGTDPEDINAGNGGSGVVIVRWVSNVNLKTITFNSNTSPAASTIQKVGSGLATSLNANSFTRTGWVFNGWATEENGAGSRYVDSGSITTAADLTLFAQWLPGVTNTVTFDANNGTGSMANQTSGTSTALSPNSFTRANYTFAGWNTQANGLGFAYSNQASYTFSANATMFAQWQLVVPTFKVTFYGNGADSGSTATQTDSSTKSLNLNGFTRTGYNFLGWNTTYNATTAEFLDGQNYSFGSDLNLYAIWVTQANNTITYSKNDSLGAPATGSMPDQIASSNTQVTQNAFTRPGYTFLNWNTSADGTGATYLGNYTYSFASSRTLYAQWGANITITFNSNSPNSGSAPGTLSTFVGSPGVNLPTNSGNLVKNGYRLAGWNTTDDGLGSPYALGASSIRFTSNQILYAHWTPATYTVIYSGNGNSAGSEPPVQTFTFGTTVNVRDNVGSLAKAGYNFEGWNTAADGTGSNFAPAQSSVALSTDTVFFAQWARVASVPNSNPPATPAQPNLEIPTPSPSPSPSITTQPRAKMMLSLTGFKPGSAVLTSWMKNKIEQFANSTIQSTKMACVGYTMGPTVLKVDSSLAKRRAITVCNYLARLNPAVVRVAPKAVTTKYSSGNYRRTVVTVSF